MRKTILVAFVAALATIVLIETVLEGPYGASKTVAAQMWKRFQEQPTSPSSPENTCTIAQSPTIASGSTAIIGHAYGAPGTRNGFIAEKVERFIQDHSAQLEAVIFSGDVLNVPSAARWQRLAALSATVGVPFHVTPGNHDVGIGENANRDVWNQSPFRLSENRNTWITASGFDIYLEDSILTDWQVARHVVEAVSDRVSDNPKMLVRHNIIVNEMLPAANSKAGLSGKLPAISEMVAVLPSGTTVVSGDSGAFPHLPRYACIEQNEVTFVANGIGEIDGDAVLILQNGELSLFPI